MHLKNLTNSLYVTAVIALIASVFTQTQSIKKVTEVSVETQEVSNTVDTSCVSDTLSSTTSIQLYDDINTKIFIRDRNKRYNIETKIIVDEKETIPVMCSEEIKIKENTLYYVQEGNYRTDLKIEYQDYLWELCKKYEVIEYYELFIAQMYHESTFRPNLISGTNDYGIMQINKCNHEWLSEELGITDFLDPYQNMECGVYIMSMFLKKYNDVEKALVCYNMGESKVKKGIHSSKYSRGVLKDTEYLVELNE